MGTDVVVPDVDTTGNGVIFAVPQNSAGPPSFKVCSAFIRPRQKADSRNPDAYETIDGSTGFRSQLTPSGFGINFEVDYKRTPIKGDTTAQKLSSTVVMRNGI